MTISPHPYQPEPWSPILEGRKYCIVFQNSVFTMATRFVPFSSLSTFTYAFIRVTAGSHNELLISILLPIAFLWVRMGELFFQKHCLMLYFPSQCLHRTFVKLVQTMYSNDQSIISKNQYESAEDKLLHNIRSLFAF